MLTQEQFDEAMRETRKLNRQIAEARASIRQWEAQLTELKPIVDEGIAITNAGGVDGQTA